MSGVRRLRWIRCKYMNTSIGAVCVKINKLAPISRPTKRRWWFSFKEPQHEYYLKMCFLITWYFASDKHQYRTIRRSHDPERSIKASSFFHPILHTIATKAWTSFINSTEDWACACRTKNKLGLIFTIEPCSLLPETWVHAEWGKCCARIAGNWKVEL